MRIQETAPTITFQLYLRVFYKWEGEIHVLGDRNDLFRVDYSH